MSFFNVDMSGDEEGFKDKLPQVRDAFITNLKDKISATDAISDYTFDKVVGYPAPKGQCYEVTYKKVLFGMYNRSTFTAYMECHIDNNGSVVVDNFDFG